MPLATLYLEAGEYEKALVTAESLAVENPDDFTALNLVGSAYFGLERYPEARKTFRQLLELEPDFLPAKFNLATIIAREGDLDGARAAYEELLVTNPDEVRAMLELAKIAET